MCKNDFRRRNYSSTLSPYFGSLPELPVPLALFFSAFAPQPLLGWFRADTLIPCWVHPSFSPEHSHLPSLLKCSISVTRVDNLCQWGCLVLENCHLCHPVVDHGGEVVEFVRNVFGGIVSLRWGRHQTCSAKLRKQQHHRDSWEWW